MSKFSPGNPSNAGNNAIHHPQRRETFKIDASTAVNSQQQRRIQLQGNSPYTNRTQEIQPRASVGSRPTPKRRCSRQNAGARRLAAHPKPLQTPLGYRPRLMDHIRATRWGIGPPPPFQGPDVGRHRAELAIYELSGAACLEHQHRSSVKKATRRATTPGAASSARAGWLVAVAVAWRGGGGG